MIFAAADAFRGLTQTLQLANAELVLVGVACLLFLAAVFDSAPPPAAPGIRDPKWPLAALFALLFAGWLWLGDAGDATERLYDSFLRHDARAWHTRGAALLAGLLAVLASWRHSPAKHAPEHYGTLLCLVAGLSLVGMANDLLALFLALELVSIPTYILLALARPDDAAHEATVKYFLLSVFSSGLLLFGMSYLYGVAGTTNLEGIRIGLLGPNAASFGPPTLFAAALILAGLGFRIAAFPFHFYSPDVLAGTSSALGGMLAFVPKVAGFAALFRLVEGTMLFPEAGTGAMPVRQVSLLMGGLAVATMFAGNLLALRQSNLRRMLAYSGVAHGGYMLAALAAGQPGPGAASPVEAVWFYLLAYGAMSVGAFSVLAALDRDGKPVRDLDDLHGLFNDRPFLAVSLAVFLFSMIGLPPTAGFMGKLLLFRALLGNPDAAYWALAAVIAVNAALGAFYYFRALGALFQPRRAALGPVLDDGPSYVAIWLCLALTFALFFNPNAALHLWPGAGR